MSHRVAYAAHHAPYAAHHAPYAGQHAPYATHHAFYAAAHAPYGAHHVVHVADHAPSNANHTCYATHHLSYPTLHATNSKKIPCASGLRLTNLQGYSLIHPARTAHSADGVILMPPAKQDQHPQQKFSVIVQVGLKALDLATTYATALTGRLDPTLTPTLQKDLASLGAAVPAVLTAHGSAAAATATQNSALETGYMMASAGRLTVKHSTSDAGVRKSYGVGNKMSKLLVKDVKDGLQTLVNRATANVAEATSFGILPADVLRYQAQITAIDTADQAQEKARAGAPKTTKDRNVIAHRILNAVRKIAGAGAVAFDTSPTERAQFESLLKKAK